jgi:AcrR family transcriptional regulator
MPKLAPKPKATPKAQATGGKILEVALGLFRTKGFDQTTMRDIAAKAGVATGAAYYYYPSKDAIMMAFYQRTFDEMQTKIGRVLDAPGSLEVRMRELIRVKLEYFGRNRGVLRGILKNGADPKHPVSPFSAETKAFREMEIAWFRRLVRDEYVRLPRELEARIPEVLWVLHIGMMFFWIADDSPRQLHTRRLIDQGMSTVTALLRLSSPIPAIVEAS